VNLRKIVSLTALLSSLLLLVTSIVLYIVPQGRVAYWADWRLLGLTKTEWTNIHVNFGLLFFVSALLHVYYNWKPIVSYLKNRVRQLRVFTPEFTTAFGVTLAFLFGTYFLLPPFSWVPGFSDSLKEAAAQRYGEPPYGHAELSTLKNFASKLNIDLDQGLNRLKVAGIRIKDENQTLRDIAADNRLSPQQVYLAMQNTADTAQKDGLLPEQSPPGTGRLTLTDICNQYNLNVTAILQALASANVIASPDTTLRQIAQENGASPVDVYMLIRQAAVKMQGNN
jgi:DnaJ-domain-containing protein 1